MLAAFDDFGLKMFILFWCEHKINYWLGWNTKIFDESCSNFDVVYSFKFVLITKKVIKKVVPEKV